MSKRTNNIFNVRVAQYAWIPVEASTPEEAMQLAEKFAGEYVTDEMFEDSEVEISGSEKDSHELEPFCKEDVITADGIMNWAAYLNAVEKDKSHE